MFVISCNFYSVVLIQNEQSINKKVTIIFGDEVDKIEILENNETNNLEGIFNKENKNTLNEQESNVILSNDYFNDLVEWLKNNHLPIKLEKDLNDKMIINILDSVYIKWPYRSVNCESTNEIILDKVRKLIANFTQNKVN